MNAEQLRALERSSYYSVVRALFACGRLETFENEMLLTDLAESLNISEQDRLAFLLQVKQDAEVVHLNGFGAEEAPGAAPGGGAAAAGPSVPEPHVPATVPPSRVVAQPPSLAIPAYQSPFGQPASTPVAAALSSKSKKKGGAMAPPAVGGVSKVPASKKSKSAASTPSTPRSLQQKGSLKQAEKKLVGAAAAAQQNAQQKQAQQEWDRLTVREREIFEALLSMGVNESDPDLNDVHKALLQWYRLEAKEKQILHDIKQTDMMIAV